MNKRRIFLVAAVALAGAAAVLRAHTSAPAERLAVVAEPPAAARLSSPAQVVVYVAGAVARPGVYRLGAGERVASAIHAAGGASAEADRIAVNLAAPLRDGEEIVVPVLGADPSAVPPAPCSARRRSTQKSGSRYSSSRARRSPKKVDAAVSIDLNRASAEELATLPGIGARLAERIVLFRERNGPFATLDDLADVNGVSPRVLQELTPYVAVH